jgi:hypothetical protein
LTKKEYIQPANAKNKTPEMKKEYIEGKAPKETNATEMWKSYASQPEFAASKLSTL